MKLRNKIAIASASALLITGCATTAASAGSKNPYDAKVFTVKNSNDNSIDCVVIDPSGSAFALSCVPRIR